MTYFNSATSFGTGPIKNVYAAANSMAALLGTGGSTITLPNDFQVTVSGNGFNFAADPNTPVVSTGSWAIGASNVVIKNNGNSTSPLTIAGPITGTAGVTFSGANGGSINLTSAKAYSGSTTVGVSGATNISVVLGAANTIASSSSVILAGGMLNPGGFNQAMSATTLGLTANSVLDYIAGVSEVDFANSSALSWGAGTTLNLANWDYSTTKLRFGTDSTGLTAAQLAAIEFNGSGLGTAHLDANGYVSVPEPSTIVLLLLSSLVAGVRCRRVA